MYHSALGLRVINKRRYNLSTTGILPISKDIKGAVFRRNAPPPFGLGNVILVLWYPSHFKKGCFASVGTRLGPLHKCASVLLVWGYHFSTSHYQRNKGCVCSGETSLGPLLKCASALRVGERDFSTMVSHFKYYGTTFQTK